MPKRDHALNYKKIGRIYHMNRSHYIYNTSLGKYQGVGDDYLLNPQPGVATDWDDNIDTLAIISVFTNRFRRGAITRRRLETLIQDYGYTSENALDSPQYQMLDSDIPY